MVFNLVQMLSNYNCCDESGALGCELIAVVGGRTHRSSPTSRVKGLNLHHNAQKYSSTKSGINGI